MFFIPEIVFLNVMQKKKKLLSKLLIKAVFTEQQILFSYYTWKFIQHGEREPIKHTQTNNETDKCFEGSSVNS